MKYVTNYSNACEICGKLKTNKAFDHTICSKIKQKRGLHVEVKSRPAPKRLNVEALTAWANRQYERLPEGT